MTAASLKKDTFRQPACQRLHTLPGKIMCSCQYCEHVGDDTQRKDCGVCIDGTLQGGRFVVVSAEEETETMTEPLMKYNAADWAVPPGMDLDDDSLFVEPIAPITMPPKYKSSDYCTYKPPALE